MKKVRMKQLARSLAQRKSKTFCMANWCSTAACVAGHAVLMFGDKKRREEFIKETKRPLEGWENETDRRVVFKSGWDIQVYGQELLGLDEDQAERLFFGNFAPEFDKITGKDAAKEIRRMVREEA